MAPFAHVSLTVSGVVPFRNLPLDATFRRATQPATLWRKVTDRLAIIDGERVIKLTTIPGREACWPAEPITRRRHGDVP